MANTPPESTEKNSPLFNEIKDSPAADATGKNAYGNIVREGSSIHYHKSLDFSNVGMPTSNENDDKMLRQFHQTRIYINDFGGMLRHGKNEAGASATYLISANLPENIAYSFGSKWGAPLSGMADSTYNALVQLISPAAANMAAAKGYDKVASAINDFPSGINRAYTAKVWGGSEALKLVLKIPVIDDGYTNSAGATGKDTNFVEALEFLGSLSLPRLNTGMGYYTPPPSPLSINLKYMSNKAPTKFESTKGRIMVQLGGILLIDNCIIENIQVAYPNTKALIRHDYKNIATMGEGRIPGSAYLTPLLAEVMITISTIEALTSDTFSKMLWIKHQPEMGTGNIDVPFVGDTVASVLDTFGDIGKKGIDFLKKGINKIM